MGQRPWSRSQLVRDDCDGTHPATYKALDDSNNIVVQSVQPSELAALLACIVQSPTLNTFCGPANLGH